MSGDDKLRKLIEAVKSDGEADLRSETVYSFEEVVEAAKSMAKRVILPDGTVLDGNPDGDEPEIMVDRHPIENLPGREQIEIFRHRRDHEGAERLVTEQPFIVANDPRTEDEKAIDRLKAFMRNAGHRSTLDEGFTAEQMAIAGQQLADELNAAEEKRSEVWPGNIKPGDPVRMTKIGSPDDPLGLKRYAVPREDKRLSHLKPEYRDLADDEQVDVSFKKDDGDSWTVSSPALVKDRHLSTNELPLNVRQAMANASGKPQMVRVITVPEARIEMFETAMTMWQTDMFPGHPDYSPKAMQWVAETLADADLYWVSPEMCTLLAHAAPIMPPTTLTADLMPSECGAVFFADALEGQDAQDPDNRVFVSAIVWGPCQFDVVNNVREDGAIGPPPPDVMTSTPSHVVTGTQTDEEFIEAHGLTPVQATDDNRVVFGATDTDSGENYRFIGNGISISTWRKWEKWVPLGRTDWPMGFDTEGEFAPPGFTPVQLQSIIEDRRWAAAFAILSQQTNISHTRVVDTDRHAAKRLRRRKLTPPKVRLVDIHKPKHPTTPGGTREVEWTKRWLVRGHWRQQAFGPGRKQRRPVYIQPHIKGPEDKPLEVSPEVVKVWRR
jgi:hypothetical protein